jgi:hypothetical protein
MEASMIIRDGLRSLVGTLCGACIVTLVALGFGAAPARAQTFTPLPPQVAFISNGKYTGTLQIQGKTLPITGTLAYLTGATEYLHISVDTEGQQITSNSWLTVIPTVINEWEIVSTFPTTCRKEVLSGDSYPQCTAWNRTPRGLYSLECTVTAQGNKATLDILAQLNNSNQLVQLQENIKGENDNSQGNESDMTDSITITMTEQGTTPQYPATSIVQAFATPPTATIRAKTATVRATNWDARAQSPASVFRLGAEAYGKGGIEGWARLDLTVETCP